MAGFRLGYFRGISHSRHSDQLSSPSALLDGIQVLYRADDGGFHTLPNLASYRRFQDIWFSLRQGSLHYDLYVFWIVFPWSSSNVLHQITELERLRDGTGSYLCALHRLFEKGSPYRTFR